MDILNANDLRKKADFALRRGREPKKLSFTYAGITLGISVLILLANLWLDAEIAGTGGLGNIGSRTVLSTAQQILPLLSGVIAMCLDLGFLSGMMRISRGQYADHTDLKTGFRKFWPLMRLTLIQSLLYFAIAFLSMQLGSMLIMFTPWAEPMMEVLTPLYNGEITVLDEALLAELTNVMIPLFILIGVLFLAIMTPFLYKMRMAYFCLLDDPNGRAMAAIRESSRMLRGRFGQLLKIDLSLWLYYAGTVLTSLVLWADVLLALLGISLPMDAGTFSLVLWVLSALIQFAVQAYLRPSAEITYLTAYDALREKPKDDGVVLGNIFDM